MDKNPPLIPFCRLFENTSAKGNRSLVGNLPYTTKLVGFQEEADDGQTVWQLYVQERPPKSPAGHQGVLSPSMGGGRRFAQLKSPKQATSAVSMGGTIQ